jgi:hypothetical protein
MSPKSAPDIAYDLPPARERKGKTRADSDRHLGNPIACHRSTLIRDPAVAMASPRQKNVVDMNLWCVLTCISADPRGAADAVAGIDRKPPRPRA